MSNSGSRFAVPTQTKINRTYAEKTKKDVFDHFRWLFNKLFSSRRNSNKKPKVNM